MAHTLDCIMIRMIKFKIWSMTVDLNGPTFFSQFSLTIYDYFDYVYIFQHLLSIDCLNRALSLDRNLYPKFLFPFDWWFFLKLSPSIEYWELLSVMVLQLNRGQAQVFHTWNIGVQWWSHFINLCWLIVSWTLKKKIHQCEYYYVIQDSKVFFQDKCIWNCCLEHGGHFV